MRKWQGIVTSVILFLMTVFFIFFYILQKNGVQFKNTSSGLKLIEEGKWENASQFFEKEISLNPNNAQAHLQLAILYADYLGKNPLAIKHYEIYLSLASTDEKAVLVRQWLKALKEESSCESTSTKSKNASTNILSEQKMSSLDTSNDEIDSLKAQIKEQKNEIEELRETVTSKENLIAMTQDQLKNHQNQKTQQEALHAKWILAKKDYDAAVKQIDALKQEKEILASQIDELTQSNESLSRTVQDITESKEEKTRTMVPPIQLTKKTNSSVVAFSKPTMKPATIRYRVKKGESLRTIAIAFYGDKDKWRLIYYSNRSKIRDPNILNPGQVLNIPLDNKK